MGLSASQGRLLLLTAKQSDLEFRAQQISQKRLVLAQQLEQISKDYEDATSNRVMSISMYEEGTDEDGKKVQTTGNLTYKNLISGTIVSASKAASAGIKPGVYEVDASSNKAYRLVDVSGAIVVASKDEIPTSAVSNDTTYSPAVKNATTGVYTVTNTDSGNTAQSLYLVPKADSELGKAFEEARKIKNSTGEDNASIIIDGKYDSVNNLIQFNGQNYKLDGSKADASVTFTPDNTIYLATSEEYVPKSKTVTQNETAYTQKEGNDGMITLYDSKGVIVNRYVVDEGLKYGTTGSTGNEADPNYLQDCLRNGKYLIEQYYTEDDNLGTASWKKISWDATSNISDRYYTEDDATAKAKYDRAQAEIQNADKKLELELDNVETQRNAVKTEIESVKKVENDNIEKSFNPFNA